MLNTPVLLIIFNRPETTAKVFKVLRQIKPKQLFVAADGARSNIEGEIEKCLATREVIQCIDWTCEVHTLFKNINAGPFWGPVSAISWFFSKVEQGIILEDDCLPDLSFFTFCEQLLDIYKDNTRIMHIAGSNFQFGQVRGTASYYFSKYTHVWGWATWRRAWKNYIDIDALRMFDKRELNKSIRTFSCNNKKEINFWQRKFYSIYEGKRQGIWDYQWNFAVWSRNGLSIVPNTNLISNIGFGKDATGTADVNNKFANLPRNNLSTIYHPLKIEQNVQADYYTFSKSGYYFHATIRDKVRWKIKSFIPQKAVYRLKNILRLFADVDNKM